MMFQYSDGNLTHQASYLYILPHSCLKLKGSTLEMNLLWCRIDICSWIVSAEGPLMLEVSVSISFLCILECISLYFIQNSIQVNSKWLRPFRPSHNYLKMISVVSGRLLNSNITYKFLSGWPVFPDYFSVSYDYAQINAINFIIEILLRNCR